MADRMRAIHFHERETLPSHKQTTQANMPQSTDNPPGRCKSEPLISPSAAQNFQIRPRNSFCKPHWALTAACVRCRWSMALFGAVLLSLGWMMVRLTDGELDYVSQGQGMRLQGNFSVAGLFPLHDTDEPSASLPALRPCNEWVNLQLHRSTASHWLCDFNTFLKPFFFFPHVNLSRGRPNKHGFHLMQAMRFAVEEINNSSGPQPLLPGVKLGYQMYDVCSVQASVLATLDLLEQQSRSPSAPGTGGDTDYDHSERALAVIGPDSSSKTFPPAALLGAYLIPQVCLNHCPWNMTLKSCARNTDSSLTSFFVSL